MALYKLGFIMNKYGWKVEVPPEVEIAHADFQQNALNCLKYMYGWVHYGLT